MVTRHDQQGFAILECLFAMLILTILATSLLAGERNGDLVARRVLEESVVTQSLESRLEELRAAPALTAGEVEFPLGQKVVALGVESGTQRVTAVEPGLFEVEVSLRWTPMGSSTPTGRHLVTRMAKAGGR